MDTVKLKTAKAASAEPFADAAAKITRLARNVETVIKGKNEVIELCLIGLVARGHVLIEDIPGVGKSTLAHAIATSLGVLYQRIQFTSDLLPSDILGLTVYDQKTQQFNFRRGPIFANIILADEINRSSPKTQSALLEAMNDRQVTIDDRTHELQEPFMVLATQNPVDHRGTFPLPESQLDRFMLRVHMGYPAFEDERQVLRAQTAAGHRAEDLKSVLTREELLQIQASVEEVHLTEVLETYLLQIVEATRKSDLLALGASTRGALALAHGAKARALVQGRGYCTPDDIKVLAVPVLAHRVLAEQRSHASGRRSQDAEAIVAEILSRLPVPV